MLCKECFKHNAEGAKRCSYCGNDFVGWRRWGSFVYKSIEVIVLIVILINLKLTINQGKAIETQIDLMTKQFRILTTTQIMQFADRAIWNYVDGGDYSSFESLLQFIDTENYPELASLAESQINRVMAANFNLYIVVEKSSKTDVHWFPKQGKAEGYGMDVSTGHLIGLMASHNHWLVRAGSAKLLGDTPREKIVREIGNDKSEEIKKVEDKIADALVESIKTDTSMGVIQTTIKALNQRQPAFSTQNIYGLEGAREILRQKIFR